MGSIGSIAKVIEDELGVFVYSIATGEGEYKDVWSSFYGELTVSVAGTALHATQKQQNTQHSACLLTYMAHLNNATVLQESATN